jgi:hypothetical protein
MKNLKKEEFLLFKKMEKDFKFLKKPYKDLELKIVSLHTIKIF